MMSRKLLLTMFIGLLLAFVVTGIALAQDDDFTRVFDEDMGWVGMLDDGRLNAYDLDAPLAVYYTHPTLANGLTSSAVTGLEIYTINPRNGVGQPVLTLTATEIGQLLNEEAVGGVDCTLAQENGVSLNYSTDGYFWVTTMGSDGKLYNFEWPDFTTRVFPTVVTVAVEA